MVFGRNDQRYHACAIAPGRLQALNELFDLPDLHVPVGSIGVVRHLLASSSLRAQSWAAVAAPPQRRLGGGGSPLGVL